MKENRLAEIAKLIEENKIEKAQSELSKLGRKYDKNADYLFMRGKVFYINKLYYAAIDTLLIALEFEQNDKAYSLIAEIYGVLGNYKLQNEISDSNLRLKAITLLKEQMTGISQREDDRNL